MIDVHALPATEQIFTHIDPETGVNTTIAATSLSSHLRKIGYPIVRVPLTAWDAKVLREKRGIEKHRLARLTVLCTRYPLLILDWLDGHTHLIADGTHSYIWQQAHGYRDAIAWLVPIAIWQPFVVSGLPEISEEKILSSFSGIR